MYTLQLIPPRGCAYVCFALRRDAARALDRLKGYKLNGSMLRVCHYVEAILFVVVMYRITTLFIPYVH